MRTIQEPNQTSSPLFAKCRGNEPLLKMSAVTCIDDLLTVPIRILQQLPTALRKMDKILKSCLQGFTRWCPCFPFTPPLPNALRHCFSLHLRAFTLAYFIPPFSKLSPSQTFGLTLKDTFQEGLFGYPDTTKSLSSELPNFAQLRSIAISQCFSSLIDSNLLETAIMSEGDQNMPPTNMPFKDSFELRAISSQLSFFP